MRSVNKVLLIGCVGKDPEIREFKNGSLVANFSIATSESYKNPQGEKITNTEWHNLAFFGRLAEIIRDYVKKGALVYVEGKIKTEKYKAKDGSERYSCKVYGDSIQILESKNDRANTQQEEIPF